jgi:hypothetical protein
MSTPNGDTGEISEKDRGRIIELFTKERSRIPGSITWRDVLPAIERYRTSVKAIGNEIVIELKKPVEIVIDGDELIWTSTFEKSKFIEAGRHLYIPLCGFIVDLDNIWQKCGNAVALNGHKLERSNFKIVARKIAKIVDGSTVGFAGAWTYARNSSSERIGEANETLLVLGSETTLH